MMTEAKHTNRLIHESSPYLLQHAHNPVDWYSWGEEALSRARAENKPILLSIGYSACHWCHVMETESFENEEIARLMNEGFISIKVDREERPDLDHIYQTVCQMLTGTGGWPLTMFLTPECEPFWGGTYFPPDDRYGRPGFIRVLQSIREHYRTESGKVRGAADEIGRALREINQTRPGAAPPGDLLANAAKALSQAFDPQNGGFGSQPKFPNSMSLEVFLRHWKNTGDTEYLTMVTLTLKKMAEGGIYDQLGGGFHRYSTDSRWLVPHFEKMLYDNALLARLYLQCFQATGDGLMERVVRETLEYVRREMTDPGGGFYSTQDADSEGEEGKFFVWTPGQVHEVLGEADAVLFCHHFGVTPEGNFEHRTSILNLQQAAARIASDYGLPVEIVEKSLARSREKLFEARERRIKPFLDDKILTGWNGLMISAFADAGKVLDEPGYVETAARAAGFLRDHLYTDGRLKRSFRNGEARGEGFLDDYAFTIAGLLDLYEASQETGWLDLASTLSDTMDELFRDSATGDYFFTPGDAASLIVRPRQSSDQSIPSGVSVAALNLARLSALLNRPELRQRATDLLAAHAEEMAGNPHGTSNLLCALDTLEHGPSEIIIRADASSPGVRDGVQALHRQYLPHKIVVVAPPGVETPPIVLGKPHSGGEMTAYVCRNFTCSRPVKTWEGLMKEVTGS